MAIMIHSPELRKLFLVVTGDEFPAVNEDELLALARQWVGWAKDLEGPVLTELVGVVRKIRGGIFGEAERAFAEQLAKYVVDQPMYLPSAAGQFRRNGEILQKLALQAAVMKRALLLELVALFVEMLWAIAMSVPTLGAAWATFLAKIPIFRFFAKTMLRRFIGAVLAAQFIGIGFQVTIVGLALVWAERSHPELAQHPDIKREQMTMAAILGTVGGAIAIPLAALFRKLADGVIKVLDIRFTAVGVNLGPKGLTTKSDKPPIDGPILTRADLERIVNQHLRTPKNVPDGVLARAIALDLVESAGGRLVFERNDAFKLGAVQTIEDWVRGAVHEFKTELLVTGEANPWGLTAGMFGEVVHGTTYNAPKPGDLLVRIPGETRPDANGKADSDVDSEIVDPLPPYTEKGDPVSRPATPPPAYPATPPAGRPGVGGISVNWSTNPAQGAAQLQSLLSRLTTAYAPVVAAPNPAAAAQVDAFRADLAAVGAALAALQANPTTANLVAAQQAFDNAIASGNEMVHALHTAGQAAPDIATTLGPVPGSYAVNWSTNPVQGVAQLQSLISRLSTGYAPVFAANSPGTVTEVDVFGADLGAARDALAVLQADPTPANLVAAQQAVNNAITSGTAMVHALHAAGLPAPSVATTLAPTPGSYTVNWTTNPTQGVAQLQSLVDQLSSSYAPVFATNSPGTVIQVDTFGADLAAARDALAVLQANPTPANLVAAQQAFDKATASGNQMAQTLNEVGQAVPDVATALVLAAAVMTDGGVYFPGPNPASDIVAGAGLPVVPGWAVVGVHGDGQGGFLVGDAVVSPQTLADALRRLPSWRTHAVGTNPFQAPDVILVACDTVWFEFAAATDLRAQLGSRRLLTGPHDVVLRRDGSVRVDGPQATSMLFTRPDVAGEPDVQTVLGPDLVQAAQEIQGGAPAILIDRSALPVDPAATEPDGQHTWGRGDKGKKSRMPSWLSGSRGQSSRSAQDESHELGEMPATSRTTIPSMPAAPPPASSLPAASAAATQPAPTPATPTPAPPTQTTPTPAQRPPASATQQDAPIQVRGAGIEQALAEHSLQEATRAQQRAEQEARERAAQAQREADARARNSPDQIRRAGEMVPVLELLLQQVTEHADTYPQQYQRARRELDALATLAEVTPLPAAVPVHELATASSAQIKEWTSRAEAFAAAEISAAKARGLTPAAQARHYRNALLYQAFPVITGAANRPGRDLTPADYAPLVQLILGPEAAAAATTASTTAATTSAAAAPQATPPTPRPTPANLEIIDNTIAGMLAENVRITPDAVVRRRAYDLLIEAGPIRDATRAADPAIATRIRDIDTVLGGTGTRALRERRAEVYAILDELGASGKINDADRTPETIAMVNHLITMMQRRYRRTHDGAAMPRPVTMEDLFTLLKSKLGNAPQTWPYLRQMARADIQAGRWRQRKPHIRAVRFAGNLIHARETMSRAHRAASAYQVRRVMQLSHGSSRGSSMPDSAGKRRQEVATLMAMIGDQRAVVRKVTEEQVMDLVVLRREVYAHPRNPRFRDASDYQVLKSQLLGRPGPVTGDDVWHMADVVRTAKQRGAANLRDLALQVRDQVLASWSTDKPGERPTVRGAQPNADRYITAFNNIQEIGFGSDLTSWLNSLIPGARNEVKETDVTRKISSLFGQTLDDGADLTVNVRGRTYGVRLWAVPMTPPQVQESSLVEAGEAGSGRFPGKGENRIYPYQDAAATQASTRGGSGDIGAMYRFQTPVGRLDATLLGGYRHAAGPRQQFAAASANYQFQRIKEPLGLVDVETAWVARIQDKETGRWKDFVWSDEDGNPLRQTLTYSVAEFMLPLKKEDIPKLSPGLQSRIDKEYLEPKTPPAGFTLHSIDHSVSRAMLAGKVLAALRDILTVEDYRYWQEAIEARITSDSMAVNLADILDPSGDFQKEFRFTVNRDGRHLSVSLTPANRDRPITTIRKASEVSRSMETRFDWIRGLIVKSLQGRDRAAQWRLTLVLLGRFMGHGSVPGRGQLSTRSTRQDLRHVRTWLMRAKRITGRLQAVHAEFDVRVDAYHVHNGTVTEGTRTVSGHAHLLVPANQLRTHGLSTVDTAQTEDQQAEDRAEDETIQRDATPDSNRRWWRPDLGYGITMDVLERINGLDRLYNQIVPFLVEKGYLPKAAMPDPSSGMTDAWQLLQSFSRPDATPEERTGAVLNRPGQAYDNWRSLIFELSESRLLSRQDDLMGSENGKPGVTMTFPLPHPDRLTESSPEDALTIGLLVDLRRDINHSDHQGVHPYSEQWSHTTIDTIASKKGGGFTADARGALGGTTGAEGGDGSGVTMRGTVGGQVTHSQGKREGANQSVAISADTDGQNMPSSRYNVQVRLRWVALLGNDPVEDTGAEPIITSVQLLQPDELRSGPDYAPTPLSLTVDDGPSVLTRMGEPIYTVVGAKGAAELQDELTENSEFSTVDVWNALAPSVFKATSLRALSGNAPLVIADEVATMHTEPVGRPQITRVWYPYSQQILEAQSGVEGAHDRSRVGGIIGNVAGTIAGYFFGDTSVGLPSGFGQSGSHLHTVGSYRGVYQDKPMALVRTKVRNTITLPDGSTVHSEGELLLNVLLDKVEEHLYGFDDPQSQIVAYYDRRIAEVEAKIAEAEAKVADAEAKIASARDEAEVAAQTTAKTKAEAAADKHRAKLAEHQQARADAVSREQEARAAVIAPVPQLDGTLAPPAAIQDGLYGATVWSLQFDGGIDQAGLGALTDALVSKALQVGGPALATRVSPIATWIGPLMGKLSDAGDSWIVNVDGTLYRLAMWAKPVGPAHASRAGGTGQKVYERSNDYVDAGRKVIQEKAISGNVAGLNFVPEDADVPVRAGVTGGRSARVEENLNRGSNLLAMQGVRANKLTDFNQAVRYEFLLQRLPDGVVPAELRRPPARNHRDLETVEEFHVLAVPTEGTVPTGTPRRRYDFTLLPDLPREYRTTAMRGLQNIFDAARGSGLGSLRDTAFFDAPKDSLTYEGLAPSLPAMLSPEGSKHSAIVTALESLDFGKGHATVHAAFGEIGQIYFMEKAEFESYSHGTDLVLSQIAKTFRRQAGFDGYALAPVAADPAGVTQHWLGGRVMFAYEDGKYSVLDNTDWIEHRAWLRQDSAVYFIYTTLMFTIMVNTAGGQSRPVHTIGQVEIVTNREGAHRLGVSLDTLKSVVPKGKWKKILNVDESSPDPAQLPPHEPRLLLHHRDLPAAYELARDAVQDMHRQVRQAEIARNQRRPRVSDRPAARRDDSRSDDARSDDARSDDALSDVSRRDVGRRGGGRRDDGRRGDGSRPGGSDRPGGSSRGGGRSRAPGVRDPEISRGKRPERGPYTLGPSPAQTGPSATAEPVWRDTSIADEPLVAVSWTPPRAGFQDGLGTLTSATTALTSDLIIDAAHGNALPPDAVRLGVDRLPNDVQIGQTVYLVRPDGDVADVPATVTAHGQVTAGPVPDALTTRLGGTELAAAWQVVDREGTTVRVTEHFARGMDGDARTRSSQQMMQWFAGQGLDVEVVPSRPMTTVEFADAEVWSDDLVFDLHAWLDERLQEVDPDGTATFETLTDEQYAQVRDSWVAEIATRLGLPVPTIVVDPEGLPEGTIRFRPQTWTLEVSSENWSYWSRYLSIMLDQSLQQLVASAAATAGTRHPAVSNTTTPLAPDDPLMPTALRVWDGMVTDEFATEPRTALHLALIDKSVTDFLALGVLPTWSSVTRHAPPPGFTVTPGHGGVVFRDVAAVDVPRGSGAPIAPYRPRVVLVPAGNDATSIDHAMYGALEWLASTDAADQDVVFELYPGGNATITPQQLTHAGQRLGEIARSWGLDGDLLLSVPESRVDGTPTPAQATMATPGLQATARGFGEIHYVVGMDGRPAQRPTIGDATITPEGTVQLDGGWSIVPLGEHAWVRHAKTPPGADPWSWTDADPEGPGTILAGMPGMPVPQRVLSKAAAAMRDVWEFVDPGSVVDLSTWHSSPLAAHRKVVFGSSAADNPSRARDMDALMTLALYSVGRPDINGATAADVVDAMTSLNDELGHTGPTRTPDGDVESANLATLRLYQDAAALFDRPNRSHLAGMQAVLAAGRAAGIQGRSEVLNAIANPPDGRLDRYDGQAVVRAAIDARVANSQPTLQQIAAEYRSQSADSSGSTTPRAGSPVAQAVPRADSPVLRADSPVLRADSPVPSSAAPSVATPLRELSVDEVERAAVVFDGGVYIPGPNGVLDEVLTNLPVVPGWGVVGVHGDGGNRFFVNDGYATPETLAQALQRIPGLRQHSLGQNTTAMPDIILAACDTAGVGATSARIVRQELGVNRLLGGTNTVALQQDGKVTVAHPAGAWILLTPAQRDGLPDAETRLGPDLVQAVQHVDGTSAPVIQIDRTALSDDVQERRLGRDGESSSERRGRAGEALRRIGGIFGRRGGSAPPPSDSMEMTDTPATTTAHTPAVPPGTVAETSAATTTPAVAPTDAPASTVVETEIVAESSTTDKGKGRAVSAETVRRAGEMIPVLELLLQQASQPPAGTDQAVWDTQRQEAQRRIDELSTTVAGALPADVPARRLATASTNEIRQWAANAESHARSEIDVANAPDVDPAARVRHWRNALLFRAFPVLTGATGRAAHALTDADFAPLVRSVLGADAATTPAAGSSTSAAPPRPNAAPVTAENLALLDRTIEAMLADGTVMTPEALVRRYAYDKLIADRPVPSALAASSQAEKLRVAELEFAAETHGRRGTRPELERRAELHALVTDLAARNLLDQSHTNYPTTVRTVNHAINMVQRRYRNTHDGAELPRPTTVDDVVTLLEAKMPNAPQSWDSLRQMVRNDQMAQQWRRGRPEARLVRFIGRKLHAAPGGRLSWFHAKASAYQVKHVQRLAPSGDPAGAMPDAKISRTGEVAELRRLFPAPAPASTAPASTVPGPASAAGPATAAIPATATVPPPPSDADLSQLVKLRREFFANPRSRGLRDLSTDYRTIKSQLLGRSGPLTGDDVRDLVSLIQRAQSLTGGYKKLVGRDLMARAVPLVLEGWSSTNPGPHRWVDGAKDEADLNLTAFNNISALPFASDLTAWLNSLVPGSRGAIKENDVTRKITSLFGQLLDDGADLTVTANGRDYGVRLWSVPMAAPQVQESSLKPAGEPGSSRFSGKGENRLYPYLDAASTQATQKGFAFDAGVMSRTQTVDGHLARVDVTFQPGMRRGTGGRAQFAAASANFQFQRIKEPLGLVDLKTAWVARVQDKETGRWKDFVWTDDTGAPVQQTLTYSVAEFMLPLTEADKAKLPDDLKKRIDNEYLVWKTPPEGFSLSNIDHSVSRAALADKVLTALRQMLPPADYLFWQDAIESRITSDAMAVYLSNILRRPGDFQKAFRFMLSRDGRHLSVSLTPSRPDQPITRIRKVSEISRSMESRFDWIRGLILKSLRGWDKTFAWRFSLIGLNRIAGGGNLQGKGVRTYRRTRQDLRHVRTWLMRAKRITGRLQAAQAEFDVRVDLHHMHQDTVIADNRVVTGHAHLLVPANQLRTAGLSTIESSQSPEQQAEDRAEDAKIASDATPDSKRRWWRPDAGYGLTMDHVEQLRGMDQLYNQIVPFLVDQGYLPPEARPAPGSGHATPWDLLQSFARPMAPTEERTGGVLNRPGQAFENWRKLVFELSEDRLLARQDDVFSGEEGEPGIAITFTRPPRTLLPPMESAPAVVNRARDARRVEPTPDPDEELTIGLLLDFPSAGSTASTSAPAGTSTTQSAQVAGAVSTHQGVHPYSLQWSHTNIDTAAAKRGKGVGTDARGTGGGEVDQWSARYRDPSTDDPATGSGTGVTPSEGRKPSPFLPRFTGGATGSWTRGDRQGKNQSVAISSDTDGQNMPSSRYDVQIRWQWVALRDDKLIPQTTTHAQPVTSTAVILQPDELHADENFKPGAIPESTEPSVLTRMGEAIYTVVGAKGNARLQREIIAQENQAVQNSLPPHNKLSKKDGWNALPGGAYKSTVMRALSGSAALVIKDRAASMRTTPVGRPQIERVWFPYTQQILEAQVGREGARDKSRLGGVIGNAAAHIMGYFFGDGMYGTPRGRGQSNSDLNTVGSYRGVYQDAPMALVRTKVVNEVTLPGGRIARTEGEVVLNVLLSKVLEHRHGFDDPRKEIEAYYTRRIDEVQAKITADISEADRTKHEAAVAKLVKERTDATDAASNPTPPTPRLDGDLAPPAALADGLSGAAVWSLQFDGGPDQAGPGALTESVAAKARALGGAALAAAVTPLVSWIGPLTSKLNDGGESWIIDVEGTLYRLAMWRRPLGPPHGSRPGGTGAKVYERSNDYVDAGKRVVRENATSTSASAVGFASAAPWRAGGTYAHAARTEEILNRGSNLLGMSGVRANKLTDYSQGARYEFLLERLSPQAVFRAKRRLLPPPDPSKQDRVTVDQMQVVAVPTEGTTPIGTPRPRYDFTLLSTLPEEYRVTGMRALQAIFDAVKDSGVGTRRDTAFYEFPADALVFERLAPSLPAMLSPNGSRHSAVATATEIIDLGSGHVTVHATFGEIGQIYFMEKAEFEKYDHGTDLTSSGVSRSRRQAVGIDGYGLAPVAASPVVLQWVGGRLTVAGEHGRMSSADQTAWIEHRAWLRQDSAVFFIYATLNLTAVVSSGSGTTSPMATIGLVELVTNLEGALELGIPIDVLAAAVPADKRKKVFGADTNVSELPSHAAPKLTDAQARVPQLFDNAQAAVLSLQEQRRRAEIEVARAQAAAQAEAKRAQTAVDAEAKRVAQAASDAEAKRAAQAAAEAERLQAQIQAAQAESSRAAAQRLEAAQEAARIEAARIEAARIEAARIEAARVEAARTKAAAQATAEAARGSSFRPRLDAVPEEDEGEPVPRSTKDGKRAIWWPGIRKPRDRDRS